MKIKEKLSKSIQSEGKRERGERTGALTRAKRAGAPGAPSLSPLSFLSPLSLLFCLFYYPLSLFPSDCIDLLSFSLIFIYGGYFRFEVKPRGRQFRQTADGSVTDRTGFGSLIWSI